MISKKLEVIIERLWTLNLEELERLSNEIEAEIQFRDIDSRMIIDSREENKNVWDYIMDSYNSHTLIFNSCNFWLIMKEIKLKISNKVLSELKRETWAMGLTQGLWRINDHFVGKILKAIEEGQEERVFKFKDEKGD